MKNFIHLSCALSLLLVGCTTDVALEVDNVDDISDVFYASAEQSATRTYVGDDGKLHWTENDRITVFKGNTLPLVYQHTGSTGADYDTFNNVTPSGGESVTGVDLTANYAVYPYSENTTVTAEGVINYTLPATQTYAVNSFGLGANVMVAVTEDKEDKYLAFKNIGGYFEFSLYGEGITVKNIVLSGNNGEKLAGDVAVTATYGGTPSVVFADDAMTSLTLDCGEGVALGADAEHATRFWFVVPAMTYTDGITLTIIDTRGRVMQKKTSNSITIGRSTVQPLSAFEVEAEPIPTNQIWYTSTDGKVVTPQYDTDFGAGISSNEYENGIGVITFDGEVSEIGASNFFGCSTLKTIIIPNKVWPIGARAFCKCSSLTSIILPEGGVYMYKEAFAECSSLESIIITKGTDHISQYAFDNCHSLKSVTIHDGLQSIELGAFMRCSSLESITIPNSVTSIRTDVFTDCSSLTSVTLSENISAINARMFWGCSSLESLTIPAGVTLIDDAFPYCSSLTTIYCKSATPPTLQDDDLEDDIFWGPFHSVKSLKKIYVPIGSGEEYKANERWSHHASLIEEYQF